MAVFIAVVGGLSVLVLVVLLVSFARRLSELTRAMDALQKELTPALEAIRSTSEKTRQLATQLEEGARVLKRDGG